jgi:pimeloyl-ACP methyl ester carboxylesterase
MTHTHVTAPTQFVEGRGVRYAYRRLGATQGVPVLLLQHFTGTMDFWDPTVVDGFARERPVVLFDNAGVSSSGGTTPDTVQMMADDAATFIAALGITQIDLLGFSLGGFIAQVLAERQPQLVRRVILAGTGPQGGEGIVNMPQVLAEAQQAAPSQPRLYLFFEPTEGSQHAGRAFIERQQRRTTERDPDTSDRSVSAQLGAMLRWGASPGADAAIRLPHIAHPVLVVNGKRDLMVPTINSYALFQQLPNARLRLYPDSGHGALFQYADVFVREGLQFLQE